MHWRGWRPWAAALLVAGCALPPPAIDDEPDGWQLAVTAPREFAQGMLWRIERDGATRGYVFGTMHSDDERVTRIPPEVQAALKNSKGFAMEVVMDERAAEQMSKDLYFSDGGKLAQMLGAPLYERAVRALTARGISERTAARMQPWLIVVTLSMPRQRGGDFLDLQLMKLAQQRHLTVSGLETVADQLRAFQELDSQQQITLLRETLDHLSEVDKSHDTALKLYLKGDLAGLVELNEETMEFSDARLRDALVRNLITRRNHHMAAQISRLIRDEPTFVAIGALHLPGAEGVLNLLKQKGYTISRVY